MHAILSEFTVESAGEDAIVTKIEMGVVWGVSLSAMSEKSGG